MAIPTLALVAIAVFGLMRLVPGDPAALMLGDLATEASLEDARVRLGLDKDVVTQFFIWLTNILSGDFGQSITTREPVLGLVIRHFLISAQVVLPAVLFACAIATPAGVIAAWKQDTWVDGTLVAVATVLLSVPTFWLGLLILLFFGLQLGWLPVVGYVSIRKDAYAGLLYLLMPVLTLLLHEIGIFIRMSRASTLEVLRLDYITHARAKGLSEAQVLRRHVLKNSFGPTWTLVGLVLGNLLGGIAVVETVFSIPGLGRLLVDSIYGRDYPVIQGCMLLIATTYMIVNLIVDVTYPVFDPRVGVE
jgi:peptide/nickel transport system permease protein